MRRRYYSKKTFSGQRYELWAMQSAYHRCCLSLMVCQATMAGNSPSDVKSTDSAEESSLSMDIAAPIRPKQNHVLASQHHSVRGKGVRIN